MKKQLGDMTKPTISLFLICAVTTAALAFTYVGTKDAIAQRAELDAEQARKEVLSAAERFDAVSDGDLDAATSGKPGLEIVKEVYKGVKGGTFAGYVFAVDSKGYGGDIRVTVGIDSDGKITGVKIGDNKETPGLGSKASEEPFLSQFIGLAPEGPLEVVKGKNPEREGSRAEEIDAISGATISSRAVVRAVQAAIDVAKELALKEGDSR